MKKLKRFVEEASLGIRVLIIYVLALAFAAAAFALVRHLGGGYVLAAALALASLPMLLAIRWLMPLGAALVERAARFFWKLRPFRIGVWSGCALAALLLALWNL